MKYIYASLFFILVIIACKKDSPDSNNSPCIGQFEADPPGQWLLGDFHVHASGASNDTGGDSWPVDIKRVAQERGLDFLVLTDHSNSTGSDASTTEEDPALFNQGPEFPYWDLCDSLTEAGHFLMVDGNEISPVTTDDERFKPTGHIGCIPMNLDTFDPSVVFIDRPKGALTGKEVLDQALDAGCFAIINHPYAPNSWIAYDWTSYDYHAIEVWNGTLGFDVFDERGRDIWICDLLSGRMVTAVGGSDCHRVNIDAPGSGLDPAIGYPTTAVFAENFDWSSIIEGLQAGKTSIFEGDTRLFIDGYTSDSCRAVNTDIQIVRLRGTVDSRLDEPILYLTQSTACQDMRPDMLAPTISRDTLLVQALSVGETFDISISIQGNKKGVYLGEIQGDWHYGALSEAIVIE